LQVAQLFRDENQVDQVIIQMKFLIGQLLKEKLLHVASIVP